MSHIHIAVTSHSLADADAVGELIAAACREASFKQVSIDSATNSEFNDVQQAVQAMRSLNPELFNYAVNITTDQIDDTPPPDETPDEPY